MTEQELIDIFDHFPKEYLWTLRIEDIFLEIVRFQNEMGSFFRKNFLDGRNDRWNVCVKSIWGAVR